MPLHSARCVRNLAGRFRRPLLLLLALLLCTGLNPARAAEVIHNFDAVVRVAKDGTLTVTETIRVRAEGREIKRGIYRDFPLYFRDAGGREREVTFKLIGVKRDGRPEPHFTRYQGNGIRIYAGKEDVFLRRGSDYSYEITYETARQLRWFKQDQAELNWNVTGNFWHFPISKASVRVELPGGARPVRWTAYTGRLGGRGTDWRGDVDSATGALSVNTTRTLAPGEGLTIVAELPVGAVEPPSASQRFWYAVRDNRRWIVGILGFALVLGYYGWAWSAVGRDPARGTIIPLFHPPQGVSPALANFVHNWGLSDRWRAFTAAALSLAVRGLLRFDESGDSLTLRATEKLPPDGRPALPAGERAIWDWIREHNGKAVIDQDHSSSVSSIGSRFQKSIESENKTRFFRRNVGHFIAGAIITGVIFVTVLIFGGLREGDLGLLIAMLFIGVFAGVFAIPVLTLVFGAVLRGSMIKRALVLVIALGIAVHFSGLAVMVIAESFGDFGAVLRSMVIEYPFPFAMVFSFAGLNGLFLYLLRAPTDIGRKVMDQIEGLRLYLTTAESARLNMQAPEITTEQFETLLPYAVALNVEKPWADAFAKALARAHPDDPDPMGHYYRPTWRTGGSNWSSSDFSSSVASTVAGVSSSFADSMPVASSSSSGFSSGGGGSGGGGGGGGGGGW